MSSIIIDKPSQLTKTVTKTVSDTAALTDNFSTIKYDNGVSNVVFTLPQDSDIAFPIGSWMPIRRTGSGNLNIIGGTGATIESEFGDVELQLTGVDGFFGFIEKVEADTWLVSGSLREA